MCCRVDCELRCHRVGQRLVGQHAEARLFLCAVDTRARFEARFADRNGLCLAREANSPATLAAFTQRERDYLRGLRCIAG